MVNISAFGEAILSASIHVSPHNNSDAIDLTSAIVKGLVLIIILLGSILGNCMVVLAIRRDCSLQTPANYLICSLAVTDLLVAFLVMPISAIYEILGIWIFGDVLCQIWSATDIACCTASILHLCAIALERHQLVTNAVRYFSAANRHAVAPKIAVVWVLAICISIPPVLGWRTSTAVQKDSETLLSNQTAPKACEVGHEPGYTVFATLGSFYIPLLLLLFLYGRIYRNIHSFVKRSESRTMLYSINSEETGSVGKRKSSLLSYLRKSNSKGSIKSRKYSFGVNKSPPCQRRASSPQVNSPTAERAQIHQEEVNTIKEDVVISNIVTTPNNKSATPARAEYRRKIYSHPSASSPTTRVRYKRSTFLRRQLAIDEELEDNLSKPVNNPSPKGRTDHTGILLNNFHKSILTSSKQPIKRRYSEGDIHLFQKFNPQEVRTTLVRSRAHTAGARVHFNDKEKVNASSERRKTYSIVKHQDTACRSPKNQTRRMSVFHRSGTTQKRRISSYQAKDYFLCCSFASKQTYTSAHKASCQDETNPYVRYSFSMRSKIKALKAREIRAIKTLGTIVGAFVICWLPFFIVTIVKPFCSCNISEGMEGVVLWLGYCNSLLNPIIYTACNQEFQAAFKKLLYSKCQIFSVCKCLAREHRNNYV